MGRGAANLALATLAFAVSFSLWGLLSGLAPLFKAEFHLTTPQTYLMVVVPVLLGSLGRIPMGILTDRFGGRQVFSLLLLFGALPCLGLAWSHSYGSLLGWGFCLGGMGASFAVGAGFASAWFPREKQGLALGIYGLGNMGQSVSVAGGPWLARWLGMSTVFSLFGALSLVTAALFFLVARNARPPAGRAGVREDLQVLRGEPVAWLLSLFYFLTFGGFVALGISLPSLLTQMFSLTPEDAGARTAGFVLLATACRPLGGWLADRHGGLALLRLVFVALAAWSCLLTIASLVPFTAGALGCAALLGLGNGGVFKLVGDFFPRHAGTVSGLVGAAGGLGGFFPPLVLSLFREHVGTYAPGFVLLSVFSMGCALVAWTSPALRGLPAAPALTLLSGNGASRQLLQLVCPERGVVGTVAVAVEAGQPPTLRILSCSLCEPAGPPGCSLACAGQAARAAEP